VRVGFDARWYNDSGVGAYVAGLLRAMATARELDLVVYTDERNPVPGLDALRVITVPVRAAKYSLAEQVELRRRASEDKLDLFHSPFFIMPLGLRCPVVVTMHDLIPFLFRIYPWPKQTLVRMGYRAAARWAEHIIADSENTARDIHALLGVARERVTTIHLAPGECFRRTDRGDGDGLAHLAARYGVRQPYVVAAGARNWRTKNLDTALEALALARRDSAVGFQTVLYGPAVTPGAAGMEIRRMETNLRVTGYVDAVDLALLFRHARAFIMPSLYEGFGLPVVEAMACGCPVLTSNAGSLPEVTGSGAQVFATDDAKGMAAAVARLVTNDGDFATWSAAALRRAEDFSWECAARQTVSVYHRIHEQFSYGCGLDPSARSLRTRG
jgi:glycosyltransferase involved in cell wall biosynthesis